MKPFQRAVRIYLVRDDVAAQVHSRLDARLTFVGSLVPDRNGRGLMTFSVPPLDTGSYTIAYWCPACAAFSRGRTFFVQQPAQFVPRYRAEALLRIATTDACPVTVPNGNRPSGQPRSVSWYGNGLLWAGLNADGVYAVPPSHVGADGSIGNKLLWVTTPPAEKPTVSGERLDAASSPLKVLGVEHGRVLGRGRPVPHQPGQLPVGGLLAPDCAPRRLEPHVRRQRRRSLSGALQEE